MPRRLASSLLRFLRDRSGNVIVTAALALPVVLGSFGLGAEGASWFATKRALQNAADAAAIAAATNAGSTYAVEAKGVAARYGQADGVDGVTVTADNSVACPAGAGAGPCYQVTVSRPMPLMLSQVVGYGGNGTLNGSPAQVISATAVAVQGPTKRGYCVLALGTSGKDPALTSDGAPDADLSGCNVMSNTGATCNGHNTGADVGDAHGKNNGCGVVQHSNVSKASDPYADLAKNIPADPCNGVYSPPPAKKKDPYAPLTSSGPQCGTKGLNGDMTITQDTTLVIYNGDLALNGHTLQTAEGASLTLIFAGSNSYSHTITGDGVLDFAAPAKDSGSVWQGVAIYQAPNLTNSVDMTYAGNSPTWDITGAVYLPHATATFKGAVNKATNGASCFVLVADTIVVSGTANILARGECDKAGVTQPTAQVAGRGKLVL